MGLLHTTNSTTRRVLLIAMIAATAAIAARLLVLATGTVSFHADEAVVALMALHILDGARPVFFYGQAYMGSLDAWVTALGFALLGESVTTIRLMQTGLYALVTAAGVGLAYRLTGRVGPALITALLLIVAPVLVVLYTTATLGGYNETLLFGTLIVWLAADVGGEYPRSRGRWLALGLLAGLGWWTNFLIAVYWLPAAALIGWGLVRQPRDRRAIMLGAGLAIAAFFVGSAPFWDFNLRENFASFGFLFNTANQSGFASLGVDRLGLGEGLIAYTFLGLPTLIGLRWPWSAEFFAPLPGLLIALLMLAAVIAGLRGSTGLSGRVRLALAVWIGGFTAVFLFSRFSADPTGRYFLPLYLPLIVLLAALIARLGDVRRGLAAALTIGVIGWLAAGQVSVATTEPGFTTQFNLDEHLPNADDAALIDFLLREDLTRGYSSYWIAFRIAFLSSERIQLDPALPPKPDLTWTPFYRRYPPYTEAAAAAERIAFVTAGVPAVDAAIAAWLAEQSITYQQTAIGQFTVWHDFAPVMPRPPLNEE